MLASSIISRIARVLLGVALFWAPLGAFAQQSPTLGSVGCLRAGAQCPGQIEDIA